MFWVMTAALGELATAGPGLLLLCSVPDVSRRPLRRRITVRRGRKSVVVEV